MVPSAIRARDSGLSAACDGTGADAPVEPRSAVAHKGLLPPHGPRHHPRRARLPFPCEHPHVLARQCDLPPRFLTHLARSFLNRPNKIAARDDVASELLAFMRFLGGVPGLVRRRMSVSDVSG